MPHRPLPAVATSHLARLGQRACMRRSARLAQHLRRADVRHGAGQALVGDELAAAELALSLAPLAQASGRAGRLSAPAPVSSMNIGAIPAADGQDQARLTACISGKSQP